MYGNSDAVSNSVFKESDCRLYREWSQIGTKSGLLQKTSTRARTMLSLVDGQ